MSKVRLIMKQGDRAMVEWYSKEEDNYYRSVVPYASLHKAEDNLWYCDIADMGIPQGVPWSGLSIDSVFDAHLFEKEMRRVGIWTLEDLKNNPQVVTQCLQKALSSGLQQVKAFASSYQDQSFEAGDRGSIDNE